MIVLVGFMGAGKSTVGRRLAQLAGLPFVDVDEAVEAAAGMSIAEIFTSQGEDAFRRLEADKAAEALRGDDESVVALGGGAVEDERTVAALSGCSVVYLETPFATALERVGGDDKRPLLARADVAELFARRAGLYSSLATVTVPTEGRDVDAIAREIRSLLLRPPGSGEPARVPVSLGERSYEVVVGPDLLPALERVIPSLDGAEKAFLVTHRVLERQAHEAASSLARMGLSVTIIEVPEGEQTKSLSMAEKLHRHLAQGEAHRGDVVAALGGGVVGDLAGFVASTYARGMRFIQLPSTLLSQVDAAIGGKTGVNLPAGKNLVGTFHQPAGVVCDVSLLPGLPEEELRSGMAEVVKYGFISDPSLLDLVTERAADVMSRDLTLLQEIVERSAAIKAAFVVEDEREAGIRAHLNYGHTFAHAIEQTAGFKGIRHGEAVSLGMMAAAHLARELGRLGDEEVELHRRTLEALGLPVGASLDIDELEPAWLRDKKFDRGVRFVLLRRPGEAEAGIAVDRDLISLALERMAS